MNASKTTTHAIVARDADLVIVLRRGPSRHVRLLRWDLRRDEVEGGQWLMGTVTFGACSLSPKGELLVYVARKGSRTFTAVSRPPYFTALAFWESELPWTGGGFFVDDDHLVLGVTHEPNQGSLPPRLKISDIWSYLPWKGNALEPSSATFGEAVLATPAAHQHWQREGPRYRKASPRNPSLVLERDEPPGRAGSFRLVTAGARIRELGSLDWADWAKDGTLLFGDAGRLYRRPLRDADELSDPSLVADLTAQPFEHIEAPEEARRWPRALTPATR